MHCSLIFTFFIAFGFCAAQNFTLPQCAQLCAGTAATAAGCYSYSNATCVCASQPFQSAIQSCFNTSCNTTTQGTAWAYYSNLCTDGSSASSGASTSTFSGSSTTTTVSATTSTAPEPVTSHTSSSTQTSSSLSSVSSTTTSAGQTTTSASGAITTDIKMLRGIMAIVIGGALIL
ncbi:hypothetical protein P692DRAFT_20829870 [Suillus brevipes Sb2]|nr:hypothetical protein P692DRAFT_20829870 [Suillus brevipes Sb2]